MNINTISLPWYARPIKIGYLTHGHLTPTCAKGRRKKKDMKSGNQTRLDGNTLSFHNLKTHNNRSFFHPFVPPPLYPPSDLISNYLG
jgi:hypothetical protein